MNKRLGPKSAPLIIEQPDAQSWAKLVRGLLDNVNNVREDESRTAQPGLRATWVAMNCIFDFLLQQQIFIDNPVAIAPIVRLSGALRDLHRGKLHRMFTIPAMRGRRHTAMNVGLIKGIAARALDELMLTGVPKARAASKVARACGTLPELGRITGDQVITWRARCRAKPGPGASEDGPVRFAYSHKLPSAGTAAERAEYLIGQVRELGRIVA